jgi:hypothetical protein
MNNREYFLVPANARPRSALCSGTLRSDCSRNTAALCRSLTGQGPTPSRKDYGEWYFGHPIPLAHAAATRPADEAAVWLNLSPIKPAMPGRVRSRDASAYKGRKRTVRAYELRALRDLGLGPSAITRKLGCCRSTVYRALGTTAEPSSRLTRNLPQQRFRCNARTIMARLSEIS